MTYILHAAGTQPLVKHLLQMERSIRHPDVVGCVQRDSLVWIEGGYSRMFYSAQDIARMGEDGRKLLDPVYARRSLDGSGKAANAYWKAADALRSSLGTPRAADAHLAYIDALRLVYAHIITSTGHVLAPIEHELQRRLKERLGDTHEQAYHDLTTPHEEDVLVRELRAWRKVAENPSDDAILAHAMRFPVMLANTFSAHDAIAWGRDRLAHADAEEIRRKIAEGEEYRARLRERQREIGDDPLAAFLRDAAVARLELKACWNGEAFHLRALFEHVALPAGIGVRDAYLFTTWQEQRDALCCGGSDGLRERIAERSAHALVRLEGSSVSLLSGPHACEEKRRLVPEPDAGAEIRGSVACKGNVEGIVRVVRVESPAELREIAKEVTRGHILVTGMTNPTMLALIDKVGGIVTDEGGITCHAAIIARERRLPCIVGCRRATLVLRDGDRIALDTDTGIVRRVR